MTYIMVAYYDTTWFTMASTMAGLASDPNELSDTSIAVRVDSAESD